MDFRLHLRTRPACKSRVGCRVRSNRTARRAGKNGNDDDLMMYP